MNYRRGNSLELCAVMMRLPRALSVRLSPLIAACKSFASVGKVMSLGCTVVSTVTRAKSFVRSAPGFLAVALALDRKKLAAFSAHGG